MMYSTVSIRFVIQDYTKGVQNSSGVLLALGGGVCVCGGGGYTLHTLKCVYKVNTNNYPQHLQPFFVIIFDSKI